MGTTSKYKNGLESNENKTVKHKLWPNFSRENNIFEKSSLFDSSF